jgi:hypothetical protein
MFFAQSSLSNASRWLREIKGSGYNSTWVVINEEGNFLYASLDHVQRLQ